MPAKDVNENAMLWKSINVTSVYAVVETVQISVQRYAIAAIRDIETVCVRIVYVPRHIIGSIVKVCPTAITPLLSLFL